MRAYTVHVKDGSFETAILVKEGFSWPAFLFTALWAAWHRMWAVALVMAALSAAPAFIPGAGASAVSFILQLGIGLVAGVAGNELRRMHLARKGFVEVAVLDAPDAGEAELRFFAAGAAHPGGAA